MLYCEARQWWGHVWEKQRNVSKAGLWCGDVSIFRPVKVISPDWRWNPLRSESVCFHKVSSPLNYRINSVKKNHRSAPDAFEDLVNGWLGRLGWVTQGWFIVKEMEDEADRQSLSFVLSSVSTCRLSPGVSVVSSNNLHVFIHSSSLWWIVQSLNEADYQGCGECGYKSTWRLVLRCDWLQLELDVIIITLQAKWLSFVFCILSLVSLVTHLTECVLWSSFWITQHLNASLQYIN